MCVTHIGSTINRFIEWTWTFWGVRKKYSKSVFSVGKLEIVEQISVRFRESALEIALGIALEIVRISLLASLSGSRETESADIGFTFLNLNECAGPSPQYGLFIDGSIIWFCISICRELHLWLYLFGSKLLTIVRSAGGFGDRPNVLWEVAICLRFACGCTAWPARNALCSVENKMQYAEPYTE